MADRRAGKLELAAIICAIASIVGYVFTVFLAGVAIVLGVMARRRTDASGDPEGRKLATVAIWVGAAVLIVNLTTGAVYFLFFR